MGTKLRSEEQEKVLITDKGVSCTCVVVMLQMLAQVNVKRIIKYIRIPFSTNKMLNHPEASLSE